jgi:hypothetical protein
VKAECGAVGDGKADDTAAIQKGLDLIRPEDSKRKILYLSAGTYRITGTVKAIREKHRELQGVGLQGEGPDKSVIVYDGAGNEPMLEWGAWYSTIRSLGFQTADEGDRRSEIGMPVNVNVNVKVNETSDSGKREVERAAKPTAGIWFGPGFSTANEVSDCAFRDLPIGIQGGTGKTQGQAEVAVERCRFERCDFGLLLANWNSLDWWLWDCVFQDCGLGVSNNPGCGNFNVYRSRFTRSTRSDLKVGHLGGFAFVENESEESNRFLYVQRGHTAGANITLQGNGISGAKYEEKMTSGVMAQGLSIRLGNPGPVLMLDNAFRRAVGATGPDVYFNSANEIVPRGSALLMGNTTTGSSLYEVEQNYEVSVIEDGSSKMGLAPADLPPPIQATRSAKENASASAGGLFVNMNVNGKSRSGPPSREAMEGFKGDAEKTANTTVVEMETGAGGDQIQTAIDEAKEGVVIHLPAGTYKLKQPLTVKTGKKVKLQGDGLLNATTLMPDGEFGERGLVEVQPGGRLEANDLALQAPLKGGGVVGMIVKTDDTDEVKVAGNQVQTTGFGPGMVVEGLDYGRVVLRNHGHNGVTVFGGPRLAKGERVPGRVEILCGASSRDGNLKPETPIYDVRQGGRILVRDIWYEGVPPEFMQVRDRGDIVFVGGHVAPNKGQGHSAVDAIQMNGKRGSVVLAQAALNGADLTIGQLAEGFLVTLFGLTPYPGTDIRYADSSLSKSLSLSRETDSKTPGFVQMMCRQNNTKITGSEPLPDVNADGDLAGRFQALREWKLPPADMNAPVKLHRVSCTGSIGLVVVRAGLGKSKPNSK